MHFAYIVESKNKQLIVLTCRPGPSATLFAGLGERYAWVGESALSWDGSKRSVDGSALGSPLRHLKLHSIALFMPANLGACRQNKSHGSPVSRIFAR